MTRPTTLTVLGVLAVVFGCLGLLGNPIVGWATNTPVATRQSAFALAALPFAQPISVVLSLCFSIALVVDGLGLLQLKGWARKLGLGLALYAMLGALGEIWLQHIALRHLQGTMLASGQGQATSPQDPTRYLLAAAAHALMTWLISAAVIYFLTRPEAVRAFRTEPVDQACTGSL